MEQDISGFRMEQWGYRTTVPPLAACRDPEQTVRGGQGNHDQQLPDRRHPSGELSGTVGNQQGPLTHESKPASQ